MTKASFRRATALEALAFSAYVGWYIWQLQTAHPNSWLVFPVWLVVSFAIHRDTPKTVGWRSDNLWKATRRAAVVFAILIGAISLTGLFLGGFHRLPIHFLEQHRLVSYFAFCVLQQVALQSFLMNRLLVAIQQPLYAAIVAGLIFAILHWPNPVLVPLTFLGGTLMCWLFSCDRNILPLAAGQTILGALVWWAFPIAWHHGMRIGPGYYSFIH